MQIDLQSSDKARSIKQLKLQLAILTKELNKTTEQLQLLEIHDTNYNQSFGCVIGLTLKILYQILRF